MTTVPVISDTFDYSKPLTDKIFCAPSQTAATCAQHLVDIIEKGENGSLWLSVRGTMTKVEHKLYWEP